MYVAICIFPRLEIFSHAWKYFPTLDTNEIKTLLLIQDKHYVCSKMYFPTFRIIFPRLILMKLILIQDKHHVCSKMYFPTPRIISPRLILMKY